MVMETVAVEAVGLLGGYLLRKGKPLAVKVGDKAMEKLESLYQAVKSQLQTDDYANQALTRVEEQPENQRRQSALVDVLAEKMDQDAGFAQALQRLLSEAEEAGGRNVVASGDRAVAIGRDATGNTIITGDNNQGGDKQPGALDPKGQAGP